MSEERGAALPASTGRTNCLGCRHYFITYEASFPYGCKLLGAKSRRQPQLDVLEATGSLCQGFDPIARDHRSPA